MTNREIAAALDELGSLYELDGANRYRVLAYKQAARAVRDWPEPVERLAAERRLTELPGIGETLAGKIDVLLATGEIPSAAKLKAKFPASLVAVTRVPGLGSKTARRLYEELGIATLEELEEAARGERLRTLRGLGPQAEENVLRGLERMRAHPDIYGELGLGGDGAAASPEEEEPMAADDAEGLIELADIRGDLQCHTTLSDGRNTLEEMALGARDRGYAYLAVTDHSATHGFGNHVTADQLAARIEEVHALDARLRRFRLLAGTEVNIGTDGSLDYPDELLAQLDWVIASVHTSFHTDARRMTDRVVTAIEHPLVHAIAHPTGRILGRRPPYDLEFERIFEAAVRTGTMLEVSADPNRLDLSPRNARAAAEAGVMLVINTDAHSVRGLGYMLHGVATARAAGLAPEQVANTRTWRGLSALLRKKATP